MNQKDQRVIRTKASIKENACRMIEEMSAEKITVKELTGRAGIHRKTFYLHYSCLEDLFNEITDDILKEYLLEMDKLHPPFFIPDTHRVFFTFFSGQPLYVQRLLCEGSYQVYCSRIFYDSLYYNQQRNHSFAGYSPEVRQVINDFIVNSTLNAYRQWNKSGRVLSLEEIIEVSSRLLEGGVSAVR